MAEFKGFPNALFTFFSELSANNNREWFTENKERYIADVVNPMGDFIEAMGPKLNALSPNYIADPRRNGGSMFRIYRDVRFAKDKKPYKEHAACQFRHHFGKDAHAPGFYVELSHKRVVIGAGSWLAPKNDLDKIRAAIVEKETNWRAVKNNKDLIALYGAVEGQALKRAPKGFDPTHPLIEDIKRKSFFVMHSSSAEQAMRADFVDHVDKAFHAASPLIQFLCSSLNLDY